MKILLYSYRINIVQLTILFPPLEQNQTMTLHSSRSKSSLTADSCELKWNFSFLPGQRDLYVLNNFFILACMGKIQRIKLVAKKFHPLIHAVVKFFLVMTLRRKTSIKPSFVISRIMSSHFLPSWRICTTQHEPCQSESWR